MRVNPNNPNYNLFNTQATEQAAREAAKVKADEAAQAEEAARLQKLSDDLKKKNPGAQKDPTGGQARRNMGYKPDGSVQTEGPDTPNEGPTPPRSGGIDIKA